MNQVMDLCCSKFFPEQQRSEESSTKSPTAPEKIKPEAFQYDNKRDNPTNFCPPQLIPTCTHTNSQGDEYITNSVV